MRKSWALPVQIGSSEPLPVTCMVPLWSQTSYQCIRFSPCRASLWTYQKLRKSVVEAGRSQVKEHLCQDFGYEKYITFTESSHYARQCFQLPLSLIPLLFTRNLQIGTLIIPILRMRKWTLENVKQLYPKSHSFAVKMSGWSVYPSKTQKCF